MSRPFDQAYYRRYYESRSKVHSKEQVATLAAGVLGMLQYWHAPLRNVLDIGAGPGFFRAPCLKALPGVRYRSTDVSEYACERYGHELRDISVWRAKEKFDLIVCQGVLPYIPSAGCAAAIENIAAMSRGFLYLEAITKDDLKHACDTGATDTRVHARSKAFYERHLRPHFHKIGAGLYYARTGQLSFYELERAW
jgi:hypothetical protein